MEDTPYLSDSFGIIRKIKNMSKTGALRIFGYVVTCTVSTCSSYFETYMKESSGKTPVRW
jgi:hypothetical protein